MKLILLDINQLTMSDWLTLISFFTGTISGALGILFYRWSVRQQESIERTNTNIQIKVAEALLEIKENVGGLNKGQEQLNSILVNAVIRQYRSVTEEKLSGHLKSSPELPQEYQLTGNIVSEVSEQTQREISSFYKTLSLFNTTDIGVLYAGWTLKGYDLAKIKTLTGYSSEIIQRSLDVLHSLKILDTNSEISPEVSLLLDGIFNIDYYGGITFSERVKSIIEVITRANKIRK